MSWQPSRILPEQAGHAAAGGIWPADIRGSCQSAGQAGDGVVTHEAKLEVDPAHSEV